MPRANAIIMHSADGIAWTRVMLFPYSSTCMCRACEHTATVADFTEASDAA